MPHNGEVRLLRPAWQWQVADATLSKNHVSPPANPATRLRIHLNRNLARAFHLSPREMKPARSHSCARCKTGKVPKKTGNISPAASYSVEFSIL